MSAQELQVVKAFSSLTIPEDVIRNSDIKGIVNDILSANQSVGSNTDRLDRLRREKANNSRISNWWNDRSDKIDEAQLDLNKSIGRLTQKSSQLLVVNTAISKVLSDQQGILLKQQRLLEEQTKQLKEQNQQILKQQRTLEDQQKDICKANQGLLEAKGLTQEQAKKLVGCVKRVEEAESKVAQANESLRHETKDMLDSAVSYIGNRVDYQKAEFTRNHDALQVSLSEQLLAQKNWMGEEFVQIQDSQQQFDKVLTGKFEDFSSTTHQTLAAAAEETGRVLEEQNNYIHKQVSELTSTLAENQHALQSSLDESRAQLLAKSEEAEKTLLSRQSAFEEKSCQTQTALESKLDQATTKLTEINEQLAQTRLDLQEANEANSSYKIRGTWAMALIGIVAAGAASWQVGTYFSIF